MQIRFYQADSGKEPVRSYLQRLAVREAADVGAALEELARLGPRDTSVDVRQLRRKLWEVRVGHHRLLYVNLPDNVAVLLHAYKKQTQRAPTREIDLALRRMDRVLNVTS